MCRYYVKKVGEGIYRKDKKATTRLTAPEFRLWIARMSLSTQKLETNMHLIWSKRQPGALICPDQFLTLLICFLEWLVTASGRAF